MFLKILLQGKLILQFFDSEISEFEGFDHVSADSVSAHSVPVFTISNSAVLVSNFVGADFAGLNFALSGNSADFNAVFENSALSENSEFVNPMTLYLKILTMYFLLLLGILV